MKDGKGSQLKQLAGAGVEGRTKTGAKTKILKRHNEKSLCRV